MHRIDKPFVAVTWDDAHASATGDYSDDEVAQEKLWSYTTYGFLLRSDDVMVVVCGEVSQDKKYRSVSFIPKTLIREVVELGAPKRQARKRVKANE